MNLKKKPEAKLAIEYRVIGEIKPSAQNAMNHSPAQIDRIAKSIQMVGWTKPIVIDEKGEILAGHGTFQAAMQLGHVEVPTVTRSGLTSAQKRAYRIADNKIASQDWDSAILAGEFADLTKMGYDMGLTGFEPSEIEALLAPAPRELPDPAIPPIEKKAVSRPGDMWLMGEHRLICADSTKPATYKTLMAGRQAQCVFTDPPYGVSYQGLGLDSSKVDVIKGDEKRRGELLKMLREAFEAAMGHTRQDAGWYIWHASSTRADFSMAMIDVGLVEHSYLIWEKPG
ncbi:MAG TPA: ParB N-terminal domain-containing protein, partial [Xanthobacteraceae bacterium]|nr:ParB N-terminal domain-containing protein [Xanthobacteraceae bacterium]